MRAPRWAPLVAAAALAACGSGSIDHGRDARGDTAAPGDAAGAPDASADALPDASADAGGGDAGAVDAAGVDGGDGGGTSYDDTVLVDQPVAFWAMSSTTGTEPDLSGHGHTGTYQGGTPGSATLPNGDVAADFDGASQYLTVPSHASLSIPTTGKLTWEAWVRPAVLQFPNNSNGYVDWMGKCEEYSPTCEWEARMYNLTNPQNRLSRLSAYVFNPGAGLGSGADWQPEANVIQAGSWYHVVGEYQTLTQPTGCSGPEVGGINIWVNGVQWDQSSHLQTGCMSQYGITPVANGSALNIGTMAQDSWFQGAIAKVAIYDDLLPAARIAAHYQAMTGLAPSGSCADTCTLQ